MYTCPVCGYDMLVHPPQDFNICPCCYTEFGYEDHITSPAALRAEWIRNGMRWEGANVMPTPLAWNPIEQLERAGFGDDLYALGGEYTETTTVQIGQGVYLSATSTSPHRQSDTVSSGTRTRSMAHAA